MKAIDKMLAIIDDVQYEISCSVGNYAFREKEEYKIVESYDGENDKLYLEYTVYDFTGHYHCIDFEITEERARICLDDDLEDDELSRETIWRHLFLNCLNRDLRREGK